MTVKLEAPVASDENPPLTFSSWVEVVYVQDKEEAMLVTPEQVGLVEDIWTYSDESEVIPEFQ